MTTIDILGRTVVLEVSDDEFVVDAVVSLRTQNVADPNSRVSVFASSGDVFISRAMVDQAQDVFTYVEVDGDES